MACVARCDTSGGGDKGKESFKPMLAMFAAGVGHMKYEEENLFEKGMNLC